MGMRLQDICDQNYESPGCYKIIWRGLEGSDRMTNRVLLHPHERVSGSGFRFQSPRSNPEPWPRNLKRRFWLGVSLKWGVK